MNISMNINSSNPFTLTSTSSHSVQEVDQQSIIICSERRTSQTKFMHHVPAMVVTPLDDKEKPKTTGIDDNTKEARDVGYDSDLNLCSTHSQTIANDMKKVNAVLITAREKGSSLRSSHTLMSPVRQKRNRVGSDTSDQFNYNKAIPTSREVSPIRHKRNRALSDTDFGACIMPSL